MLKEKEKDCLIICIIIFGLLYCNNIIIKIHKKKYNKKKLKKISLIMSLIMSLIISLFIYYYYDLIIKYYIKNNDLKIYTEIANF